MINTFNIEIRQIDCDAMSGRVKLKETGIILPCKFTEEIMEEAIECFKGSGNATATVKVMTDEYGESYLQILKL